MKYGAKLNCLKQIKLLNETITQNEWKILKTKANELDSINRSIISHSLAVRINKNYQEEQNSKGYKNYKSVVYSNFKKIKNLTKNGTFPGEYLIGIDTSDYATKISECSFGNSKVVVTLLHYDYPVSELTEEVLLTAIKKGQLHPREFASIYTFEKNKISKLYRSSNKTERKLSNYNFAFPFEKRKDTISKINDDRFKFGICSMEIDKKKRQIENKHDVKLFFGYK